MNVTIERRAAAAFAAHAHAWRMQRAADQAGDPADAARWAQTRAACSAELEDLRAAQAAGVDAAPADGILRGNADIHPGA
ncbi:hypothetical protein [Xanthomonas sp. XNM01]|uniref:hypothetical protein n=1 Tax=Xanthomonas sp. XNM01 TaxID=2769289 RepID=UPI0017814B2B|nr:hypothetical protein [Xanthomonas sp. XNM01]MBD9368826.1 hypothetical protein [Xanthomonas sp. XNM01]